MIYGITGPAGSGKDTAGAYIVSTLGATHLSFATPIKAALAAMGFPEPANRDDKESTIEGYNFSWRKLAQTLGTDWRKMVDDELWLKLAMAKIEHGKSYVFTDIRFDLEANAIRQQGGIIIHLDGRKVDLKGLESHASEQGIIMMSQDYFVDNSGSLDELYTQLKGIICE